MTTLIFASFASLATGAANAAKALVRWYHGRQAYNSLCQMDERALSDIGLSRSDLRDASAVPLYGDPTGLLARNSAVRRPYLGRRFGVVRAVVSPSLQYDGQGQPQTVR